MTSCANGRRYVYRMMVAHRLEAAHHHPFRAPRRFPNIVVQPSSIPSSKLTILYSAFILLHRLMAEDKGESTKWWLGDRLVCAWYLVCHEKRSATRRLLPYRCPCLIDRIVASGRPIAVGVLHEEQFVTMKRLGSDVSDNQRCFDGCARRFGKVAIYKQRQLRRNNNSQLQPCTIHAEKRAPLLFFVVPCALVVVGGCPCNERSTPISQIVRREAEDTPTPRDADYCDHGWF